MPNIAEEMVLLQQKVTVLEAKVQMLEGFHQKNSTYCNSLEELYSLVKSFIEGEEDNDFILFRIKRLVKEIQSLRKKF